MQSRGGSDGDSGKPETQKPSGFKRRTVFNSLNTAGNQPVVGNEEKIDEFQPEDFLVPRSLSWNHNWALEAMLQRYDKCLFQVS